jgi:probable HAF family extracellular repeat protein
VPTSFITIDAPGASNTDAYGINDASQIVGSYDTGDGPQGFLLSGGSYTTLNDPSIIDPPIGSGHYTVATGINASGQIVGYYNNTPLTRGFLYTNGNYTPINGTFAEGINEAGQIVGYSHNVIVVGSHILTSDPGSSITMGRSRQSAIPWPTAIPAAL